MAEKRARLDAVQALAPGVSIYRFVPVEPAALPLRQRCPFNLNRPPVCGEGNSAAINES